MLPSESVILFQTVLSDGSDAITLETLVDLIKNEGLETYTESRWASILHAFALCTVIGREIRSVYPDVQWNFRKLFNCTIRPVGESTYQLQSQIQWETSDEEIVLFWTRDSDLSQTDVIFTANHVVPLMKRDRDLDVVIFHELPNKKRKTTKHKLETFFIKHSTNDGHKPEPCRSNSSNNAMNESTSEEAGSMVTTEEAGSMVTTEEAGSMVTPLFPGVCPDLATLISRRVKLADNEKFHILTFNTNRLPTYPSTKHRKYSASWETQYKWLRYSVSEDGAFCASCFVFAPRDNYREFICSPFKDWKNAVGAKRGILPSHNRSKTHIDSMTASVNFLKVYSGRMEPVSASLSTAYSEKRKDNQQIMLSIIEVIINLSSRSIPLRGSWLKDQGQEDSNFLYFMQWISKYDKKLLKHLENGPINAKYTSPQFQNEIITLLGQNICNKIVGNASKSRFFSVIADETTDVSVKEQMSVCVRYVFEKEVCEDFIGFVELPKTDSGTITTNLILALNKSTAGRGIIRPKVFCRK